MSEEDSTLRWVLNRGLDAYYAVSSASSATQNAFWGTGQDWSIGAPVPIGPSSPPFQSQIPIPPPPAVPAWTGPVLVLLLVVIVVVVIFYALCSCYELIRDITKLNIVTIPSSVIVTCICLYVYHNSFAPHSYHPPPYGYPQQQNYYPHHQGQYGGRHG